ncbi:hypothetical protein ADUPG1_010438, partial [Aduncisulcus paluster]
MNSRAGRHKMHLQGLLFSLILLFILINTAHSSDISYSEGIPPNHAESWVQQDRNAMKGNLHHNTHKMDNLANHNSRFSIEYMGGAFRREDASFFYNSHQLDDNIGVEDRKLPKSQNDFDNYGSSAKNMQIPHNQINSSVTESNIEATDANDEDT